MLNFLPKANHKMGSALSLSQRTTQAQTKDSFTDPILVLDDLLLLLLQDKRLLLKSQQKSKHLK